MSDLNVRIRLQNLEVLFLNLKKNIFIYLNFLFLQTEIEGLLGGGDLGVLVNELFKDMLLLIIDKGYALVSASIKDNYLPRANEFMNGKTLMEVLELLQN